MYARTLATALQVRVWPDTVRAGAACGSGALGPDRPEPGGAATGPRPADCGHRSHAAPGRHPRHRGRLAARTGLLTTASGPAGRLRGPGGAPDAAGGPGL